MEKGEIYGTYENYYNHHYIRTDASGCITEGRSDYGTITIEDSTFYFADANL